MALFLQDHEKKALVRLKLKEDESELGFATRICVPDKEDPEEKNVLLITSPSIFPNDIDERLDDIEVHRCVARSWLSRKFKQEPDPPKVKNIENHKKSDVSTVVFEGGDKKLYHTLQYKVLTDEDLKKKEHKELCACVFEGKKKIELLFKKQGGSYKLISNVSKKAFDAKRAEGAPVIIAELTHYFMGIPRYAHKVVGVLSINSNGELYPLLFKDGFLEDGTDEDTSNAEVGDNASRTNVERTSDQPAEKDFSSRALEYTEKLKSSIKKQTDFLLAEEEDKKIRTDDIFTNVTIQRGKKQFKKPGPKETRYGRRQMDEVPESRTALKTCSEMFVCPENDQKPTASGKTNPKSILLIGKGGIGKSLFCRKLVRDWSDNKLFEKSEEKAKVPDFQFVFLLTFRQFLLPEEEKVDLRDILNKSSLLDEHSAVDEPLLQYIIENPEKLVIILDGYDEYKHREKITGDFETRYPNNPHEKIPVPALLAKIMKGKMLKESVVVVTSRPGEAEELKKIIFDVRCDIQGFSSPQVVDYIKKYFKENESMKKKVIDQVKANEILLSFGHIPVMCYLMCYCIKWYMTESKTTDKLPVTRTELYHQVIKLFIKKHSSSKYEEMEETKVQEILHKLCKLAANLTKKGQYIFNESDMRKLNFKEEEITNLKASGLLDCCPGVKKCPSEKPPLEYTFTHLTIHEYLCAFLFVEKKEIPKEETSAVTLEFVAGILSTKNDEKLMEKLIENIKPENVYDDRNKLLTLSCLYEYKDDGFSTRIINNLKHRYCDEDGWIEFSRITDIDCLYISYLLDIVNLINAEQTKQHLTSTQLFIVKTLHISYSSLSASGIRMLCNSLVSISTVTVLWLEGCELDDECVVIISNIMSRTNITDLHLMYNNITNVGLQCLYSVLKTGDCRVKVLYLGGNDKITVECEQWARQQIPDVKLHI